MLIVVKVRTMIAVLLLVTSFIVVATGISVGSYKHPKYDGLGYTLTLAGAFMWIPTIIVGFMGI